MNTHCIVRMYANIIIANLLNDLKRSVNGTIIEVHFNFIYDIVDYKLTQKAKTGVIIKLLKKSFFFLQDI